MKTYYYKNSSQPSITTNYKVNGGDLGSNYYVTRNGFTTPFYKHPIPSNYKVNTYYTLFTYLLFADSTFINNNT